ncbi:MAG: hypothetical protein M3N57_10325 [Actinomycetota bacterium]|nr:hypothetical protein [Actinomycetota bacterium]
MDERRYRAVAAELAPALNRHLTELLDDLVEGLAEQAPQAGLWSEEQREQIREGIRQVLLGLLRFLRIGDLEAHQCERLRRVVAAPVPGLGPGHAGDVPRLLRMDALDVAARLLGPWLTDERRRVLDHELERYFSILQPPDPRVGGSLPELDQWLARIAAEGTDRGPAPGSRSGSFGRVRSS